MSGIVERLRNYETCHDGDIDQAADMLDFLLSSMQSHSLKMDGQHSWRFSGGWPLSSVRAASAEEAVMKAMEEVKQQAGIS